MIDTTPTHRRAVTVICCVWAGWLGVLALLGALGLGTGLAVWPMGEDRNWIALLKSSSAGETARSFWAIDHRNPLSPWWYIAFRHPISAWPYGLFMLRHIVGLTLALSIYALVATWLGQRARSMAFVIGCLVCIHTSNAFFDQIYWNFQAALACSMICVTCWLQHDRAPKGGGWLALALVFWLLAIATYTIQAGAMVAIGFAAFVGTTSIDLHSRPVGVLQRLRAAGLAVWPFATVFVLFVMIWQTTSIPSESFIGHVQASRLFDTLMKGLVHPDTVLMTQLLERSPHRLGFVIVGIATFCLVLSVTRFGVQQVTSADAMRLVGLVGCLAVPTMAVETLGTQWPPGSRWRMIYQVTTPAFTLGLLACLCSYAPGRGGAVLLRSGIAALFALAAVASLVHNERQMVLTHSEKALRDAIRTDAVLQAAQGRSAPHYLVFLDESTRWFASDTLSGVYASTWFPHGLATFRLVPSPLYEALQPGSPVTFLDTAAGVAAATIDGKTMPYDRVRFVLAKSGRYIVVDQITKDDIGRFRVVWQRREPVAP